MEIQGYPDYLIYSDGRVYSKKRKIFMKQSKKRNNYYCIKLYGNQEKLIHRLIAEHYIPNPENKREVDHIDRDKSNNNVENLRWATRSENQLNKGITKTNKSGYKYISFNKRRNAWRFNVRRQNIDRHFKSKIKCICYKFLFNLKTACNIHLS